MGVKVIAYYVDDCVWRAPIADAKDQDDAVKMYESSSGYDPQNPVVYLEKPSPPFLHPEGDAGECCQSVNVYVFYIDPVSGHMRRGEGTWWATCVRPGEGGIHNGTTVFTRQHREGAWRRIADTTDVRYSRGIVRTVVYIDNYLELPMGAMLGHEGGAEVIGYRPYVNEPPVLITHSDSSRFGKVQCPACESRTYKWTSPDGDEGWFCPNCFTGNRIL